VREVSEVFVFLFGDFDAGRGGGGERTKPRGNLRTPPGPASRLRDGGRGCTLLLKLALTFLKRPRELLFGACPREVVVVMRTRPRRAKVPPS